MMPLCTTAISSRLKIGWALTVTGAPWVAQRVWQMPVAPVRPDSRTCASRSATRDTVRARRSCPPPAASWTATPQES